MICGQTRVPGVSVSQVARRYDVNANLVFAWLRDPRFADAAASDVARFLPVDIRRGGEGADGSALSPRTTSRSNWRAGTGCGSAAAMIPRPWRG
jgi:hypothetical protein